MPPDALESQNLQVAKDTFGYAKAAFWVGFGALVVGAAAAFFTLQSLWQLTRKPKIAAMGLRDNNLQVPPTLSLTPFGSENHGERIYHVEVSAHNTGKVQADNYRLTVLVRVKDMLRLYSEKLYENFDVMRGGQGEVQIVDGERQFWDDAYYEGRNLPVTPGPLVVAQLKIIHNASNNATLPVKFRFSSDGGYYTESVQMVTFKSAELREGL